MLTQKTAINECSQDLCVKSSCGRNAISILKRTIQTVGGTIASSPYIRASQIYLDYAEALFEGCGSATGNY